MDITEKRYKLTGACKQCGECCINEQCENLKMENNKAICLIHDNKPDKCRLFPELPPIIFKNCNYGFIDLWENKILKAGEI